MQNIHAILRQDEGTTAIEYSVIAGLVAVALAASLGPLSDTLIALFNSITGAFGDALADP